MSNAVRLPRNTTQQAEGLLYGDIARILHRVTGAVIIVFVLVHVAAKSVLYVPAFASLKAGAPWLPAALSQHWIYALLYFSIVFHALYGLKLLADELGARFGYRGSLGAIIGVSALFGLREALRYAGI